MYLNVCCAINMFTIFFYNTEEADLIVWNDSTNELLGSNVA